MQRNPGVRTIEGELLKALEKAGCMTPSLNDPFVTVRALYVEKGLRQRCGTEWRAREGVAEREAPARVHRHTLRHARLQLWQR